MSPVFTRSAAAAAVIAAAGVTALAAMALTGGPEASAAAAGAAGSQQPRFIALVSQGGEITIRRSDNEKVIGTIRPGMFEQTWQFRGASGGGAQPPRIDNGAASASGVINAPGAGASVALQASAQAEGSRLRLRYEMTANKPVPINSLHASVNVSVSDYIGAPWQAGGSNQSGTVPASPGATQLISGETQRISLGEGERRIVITARPDIANAPPMMIQDSRVFSGGDLEIRVGAQGERTLPANAPEVISMDVELPGPVAVEADQPITLTAGEDWIPLELKLDIAPNSALDFSRLWIDAPAGKHGWLVALPDGRFAFEKQRSKPVRFYGANLAFSANYLSKDEADRLAERFARIGYNTVRIHHHEGELIQSDASDSLTFRQESLDKLDYLVAAMKKRGIYTKTDLFVSRPVKAHETGANEAGMDLFKAAVLVSPVAMDNWKAFTKKLLTHVNPYTGLAYKDDPALAWLCMINEPNLTNYLGRLSGNLATQYQREWETWLKNRYGTDEKLRAAWADTAATLSVPLPRNIEANTVRGNDVAAFAAFIHLRAFSEMRRFVEQEIGAKQLLTDMNGWSETPAFMAVRTEMDWVDNHFYWDHPNFLERDWSLPSQGGSGGRGAVETAGAGPSFVSMTRLFGKPFSVSEYNYSSPNPFRAEGGLIMGAASALQDWDAVWRFAYSHSRDSVLSPRPLNYFDMAVDPAGMAGERAALMLFLRRDAKPAQTAVSLVRDREDLMGKSGPLPRAGGFGELALVCRVGVHVAADNKPLPDAKPHELRLAEGDSVKALAALRESGRIKKANRTDLSAQVRESETGEILVDGRQGLLRINTARTVGGVAPAGQSITTGPLSAAVRDTRAAIWASSLDNQPVSKSKRLLLVHLTDVQNSNMRYRSRDRRVLEAWGDLPHLARRGSATVTLTHDTPGRLKAWRLDTAGNRVAPVTVKAVGKQAVLEVSTKAPAGGATLYYEVAAE